MQTTTSEALLAQLCRRAFLSLWSYPNVYRDQGRRGHKGDGKELCDLLVVFGNDVIIFSDKHCHLSTTGDPNIDWPRWYRKAILKSAAQIKGAERWIGQRYGELFVDRGCTRPLPISLPEKPRIHRIITCRGSARASKEIWGGSGSLVVTNYPLEACLSLPLHLGSLSNDSKVFHVFDEISLEAVMTTLDTVADFCEYLVKREEFFLATQSVIAAGEKDLLAFYLYTPGQNGGHGFSIDGSPSQVLIDEGFWNKWEKSAQREAKVRADGVSKVWDDMIERFSFHMINRTQEYTTPGGVRENEILVRWMARESRVRRRMFAQSILEMIATTPPGQLRRRLILPSVSGDPCWIFLVLPHPDNVSYADYRRARREFLGMHCQVAKYLNPAINDFVGIALDPHGQSEDAIYFDAEEWSENANEEAKKLQQDLGIFQTPTEIRRRYWEYPLPDDTARKR